MQRWVTVMTATALALVLAASAASAQSNCDWYAKTALKQQQDNQRMRCGFNGEAWNADLKAHAVWCQSVSPDIWQDQAKKRDRELIACAKK